MLYLKELETCVISKIYFVYGKFNTFGTWLATRNILYKNRAVYF